MTRDSVEPENQIVEYCYFCDFETIHELQPSGIYSCLICLYDSEQSEYGDSTDSSDRFSSLS